MTDPAADRGLTGDEAERRLAGLGPMQETSSRSTSSIIAGNVFTLFNLIIGIFFILILSLGLFADAIFGVIAIINSYIGIRQELKAKETLDRLAIMIAPRAQVVRDGNLIDLLPEEVVPGDVILVEPGDQLIADGEAIQTRGLTVDESVLTGESDGVLKQSGDRILSGAFCVSGSGYYEVDAVREQSYAGRIAGEAKAFRHPPSPLQEEVNQVILVCTYVMLPLGILLIGSLIFRSTPIDEAAQTATAGLITLIPEGLVLLMSVTFAVAAVRLAKRGALIQQMSATESLAAVDTICIDKTGTLTDGELNLVAVETVEPEGPEKAHRALSRFANSAGSRNGTLEAIAEQFPGDPEDVTSEVPFSSEWKWSGLKLANGRSYMLGAPDVLQAAGVLTLPPALVASLGRETSAGRRVVVFGETTMRFPENPASESPPQLNAIALVVLEETLRPDAAETIETMRSEAVELKLISGDARATVTAVARAIGVPEDAGVIEGTELPSEPDLLGAVAEKNTIFCRIKPDQKKALVMALSDSGHYTAMIGDGVNDVPALKQARMAVAMGSGSQVTKGIADVVLMHDEFAQLPRAVGEGRRIARNIHRLGRLYLTKSVYAMTLILLVAVPGFTFPFLPRHLTLAAFLTIGIPSFVLALAPSDGPLYRGHLIRSLAAFAVPAGVAMALGSILSYVLVSNIGGDQEAGRTAATTTLIILGLSFVLLLERGPGRQHIAIQSYMLAMVAGLGAVFALILAVPEIRNFFEMTILSAAQWFMAMLSAAIGLVLASVFWRLPQIQRLEAPDMQVGQDELAPISVPIPAAAYHVARAASRFRRRRRDE